MSTTIGVLRRPGSFHASMMHVMGLLQLSAVWLLLRGDRTSASASPGSTTPTASAASSAVAASSASHARSLSAAASTAARSAAGGDSASASCGTARARCLQAPVHGVVLAGNSDGPAPDAAQAAAAADAAKICARYVEGLRLPSVRHSRSYKRRRSTMATMSPYAFVHPLSVGLAAAPALAPPSSAEGRRWQAQPAAGNAGAAARCAVPTAAPAAASADAAAAAAAWRVPPRTVAWGPTAPGAGARLQQMSPLFAAGLLDSGGNRRRRRYAPGRKRRMVKALVRYLLTGDRGGAEEFWEGQGSGGGGAADLARLAAVAALGASPAGPIGGGSGGITAEMATTFMSASTSSSSSPSASSPSSLPPSATSSASASLSPAAAARPRVSARMASTTTATPTRPSVARPPPSIADDAILGAEYDDLDEAELTAADAAADAAAGPPLPGERIPLTSRVLKWAFERVIRMRATRVEGLEVFVSAKSNRRALSGDLQTVGINWDALALPQLQITGGAKVQITGVDLKVLFLVWRRFMAFKRPFEVSGYYVFTNSDVVGSPLIRRLVQAMLNATLRKLEDYATDRRAVQRTGINVLRVMIKKSKLVVDGEVVYDKFRVPFNYRTGLGISKRGHVVYLRDPEVFWDNVGGSLTLPLVPLQAFDVDIGDNARIEHIDIRDGRLTVRARFVLSPIPPLVVADVSKRAAFRYDLGERLSISFGGLVDNAFRLF